jgi:hypothetical protein
MTALECGGSTPLWIALGFLGRCLVELRSIQSGAKSPHSKGRRMPVALRDINHYF